jgi:hypothetical protein
VAALGREGHRPCGHRDHTVGSQQEGEAQGSSSHPGDMGHGDRGQDVSDLRNNLVGLEEDTRVTEGLPDGTGAVGGDLQMEGEVDGPAEDSHLEHLEMAHIEGLVRSPGPGLQWRAVEGHSRQIADRE